MLHVRSMEWVGCILTRARDEQLLYEADDGNHAEDAQLLPIAFKDALDVGYVVSSIVGHGVVERDDQSSFGRVGLAQLSLYCLRNDLSLLLEDLCLRYGFCLDLDN